MNALQKKDTPEYVLQPNEISQAIYSLGPYARKLIAMAMSLVPPDEGEYEVSFKVSEFLKAIGLNPREQGLKTRACIKAAVRECLSGRIEIDKPNEDWEAYLWLTYAALTGNNLERANGWEKITMVFNPTIGEVIKAFKRGYSKINLADLGKLQSRYALRFYETALSFAGFAGQGGNRRGEWYFEMSIDDIRKRFQIDGKKYKDTKNFRVNVIDNPIEEINAAGLGLRIEPDYVRDGKWLIGARFRCRWIKRDEPVPTNPATETGQDEEKLRTAYPEEFEKLKTEELAILKQQPGLFYSDNLSLQETHAEAKAFIRLKELYSGLKK
jgi:hypothetical protein